MRLQITAYVRNLPGVLMANVGASALISLAFFPHVDRALLLSWFASMVLLMGYQGIHVHRFLRDPSSYDLRRLQPMLITGAGLTGVLWAVMPWICVHPTAIEYNLLALFVIGIINAGGAATLSPFLPAYLTFLALSLTSCSLVGFQYVGDLGLVLGFGHIMMGLLFGGLGWVIASTLRASCRLQVTQAELLTRLQAQAVLLQRTAEEAQVANRAKSEFLATISHEIRTPINAILGGMDLLGATTLEAWQRQCVDLVGKAGQSLLALLDDLLDFGRIEAGRLELESATFNLHERLHDTVDLMMSKAAEKGLDLRLAIDDDVPEHIRGDAARLRQVMFNLIGNAIKFTAQGLVDVRVTNCAPPDSDRPGVSDQIDQQWIMLQVIDSGIGIAEDRLAAVFEPFCQEDGSIARRFGGSGLGLAISRRLVELMGGRISANSSVGVGSVFRVELPVEVLAQAPAKSPSDDVMPTWHRSPTLLLVEDEDVNAFVATQLLQRHGFILLHGRSGKEALRLLAAPEGQAVEAILMDLGMPERDGFSVMEELRAPNSPYRHLPVIALTASVLPETIDRCRAMGMAGFVAKPIRLPVLLRALAEVIQPDSVSSSPEVGRDEPMRLTQLRQDLGDSIADAVLTQARKSVRDVLDQLDRDGASFTRRQTGDVAHRIAGTLETIGAEKAALVARRVEHAAAEGPSDDIGGALAELRETLAILLSELPDPERAEQFVLTPV